MRVALDYDNTYTADPEFWNAFIARAKYNGHQVRIVTARDERFDRTAALAELEKRIPVIYCRGVAKQWYLTHFGEGFTVDVWIDDKPESILNNSEFSPDNLATWRANRGEGDCL